MDKQYIVLTPHERMILQSYIPVVEGLGNYLGEGYEIILHNLQSLEHSVMQIVNGYHSGRKVGAPITDLALAMLAQIESSKDHSAISHKTETFTEDVDELIEMALADVKDIILNDTSVSANNKNKEIVTALYKRGIFNLKDSVVKVAEKLKISKNTVYMHIRNLKNE